MRKTLFYTLVLILGFGAILSGDAEKPNISVFDQITLVNLRKNEIYARNGYRFSNNQLDTYFRTFEWYTGGTNQPISLPDADQKVVNRLASQAKELIAEAFNKDWNQSLGSVRRSIFRSAQIVKIRSNLHKSSQLQEFHYVPELMATHSISFDETSQMHDIENSIEKALNGSHGFSYLKRFQSSKPGVELIDFCYVDQISGDYCNTTLLQINGKIRYGFHAVGQTSYTYDWIVLHLQGAPYLLIFRAHSMGEIQKVVRIHL